MSEIIKYLEENKWEKVFEYRICKWTWESFPIFQSDVDMINKLSPTIDWKKIQIPLPTLSPKARQIRRLLFRNEWNFYKSRSSKTWEPMISLYSPENEAKIFDQKEWWQEDWDPMDYWFFPDYEKSINSQLFNLRNQIPRLNLVTVDNTNSDYTTWTWYCKNCYLINSSENSENCYYWKLFQSCSNCTDCSYVYDSEKLYECLNVKKGFKSIYLHNSNNCSSCYYSDDLIGCDHCIFSSWLRNSSYFFENEKLSKEEWLEKAKEFLYTRKNIDKALLKFSKLLENRKLKYASVTWCENSYWDTLIEDKNCYFCYDVNNSEDCRYVNIWVEVKYNMDCNNMYLKPERSYEVLWTIWTYNVLFSTYIFNSSDVFYSQDCHDCKNLFGCIWLRNKEYCIFNKQYTKEEWGKIVLKVIDKMSPLNPPISKEWERNWEWGEYFDVKLTAFPYNDSLAMEYFPVKEVIYIKNNEILKREIINQKWEWTVFVLEPEKDLSKAKLDLGWVEKVDILWKTKEKEIWIPENIYLIETKDLKESILEEDESIFKKAIKCSKSWRLYRITGQEFDFYKKMNLPLPNRHPNVRYFERLAMKPSRNLYLNTCIKCDKQVLSVFDKSKKVYCEKCYNKEVY